MLVNGEMTCISHVVRRRVDASISHLMLDRDAAVISFVAPPLPVPMPVPEADSVWRMYLRIVFVWLLRVKADVDGVVP